MIQYYALTQYGTTKQNPFAVARLNDGIFERYLQGKWIIDDSLADIFIGEFIDYEQLTEAEALNIIAKKVQRHVQ
jgi:hypothetical protein